MILRKINAGLSLLCTVMLMVHAISIAAWMLSRGGIPRAVNPMPWILIWVMVAHAILSIVLAFLGHKGAEKRTCNGYFPMNAATYIQRMGGILLLPLTALHVAGTVGVLTPPPAVHAILPPLFFAVVLMHVAISTGKALITLGIGNAAFVKAADIAIKALCALTLVADVVGFYLFVV